MTPPTSNMHFVGAHYHCHAPTCISMEIYNNATGELLCREQPYHGQVRNVPNINYRSFYRSFANGSTPIFRKKPLRLTSVAVVLAPFRATISRAPTASMSLATSHNVSVSGPTKLTALRNHRK